MDLEALPKKGALSRHNKQQEPAERAPVIRSKSRSRLRAGGCIQVSGKINRDSAVVFRNIAMASRLK